MGLTEEHRYTNDGRKLTVERSIDDDRSVYINVGEGSYGAGIWLDFADTVPLALNVLGYDRPELGDEAASWSGATFCYSVVASSSDHRDELPAQAAANLKAVDLYDQSLAKKQADEEAAAKAAEALKAKAYAEIKATQAKRDAERDKRIAAKEAARMELHDLTRDAFALGVTASRADTLAEAVTKYKAAVAAVGAPIF